MAALLTRQLVVMVEDFRTRTTLVAAMEAQLKPDAASSLESLRYDSETPGHIDVLAVVRTPRPFTPQDVKRFQESLGEAVGKDVSLFVRCALTQDVAAAGSAALLPRVDLDGNFLKVDASPDSKLTQEAEQILLELVGRTPRYRMIGVELAHLPSGPVIVASVNGSAALGPGQVEAAEATLRTRVGRDDVKLLVRTVSTTDLTAKGRVLLGGAHFAEEDPALREQAERLETEARRALEALAETVVVALDVAREGGSWAVRSQVAAARPPHAQEVARIEAALARTAGAPVSLSVWWTSDLIVTRDGLHRSRPRPTPRRPRGGGDSLRRGLIARPTWSTPTPSTCSSAVSRPDEQLGASTRNSTIRSSGSRSRRVRRRSSSCARLWVGRQRIDRQRQAAAGQSQAGQGAW